MKKKNNWKSPVLLFLAALIWGIAFVAQSAGMEYVGPFTFNGIRSLLGAVVLCPLILVLDSKQPQRQKENKRTLWTAGILCGLCLCVASSLQQLGIQYTSAGKAGFLTALYIVMVPIIGFFMGKKCNPFVGVSIVLATIGLYLLSIQSDFSIGKGDMYVIVCAVVFSVHILIIDHFSPKCNGVKLSCIQFLVCGVICTGIALVLEQPDFDQILQAWLPIGYAGIFSCGVAYTLQIVGQKGMNPTVAALILSLESVVSVLAGWILLQQRLSKREILGCCIMFLAIILAQMQKKDKMGGNDELPGSI